MRNGSVNIIDMKVSWCHFSLTLKRENCLRQWRAQRYRHRGLWTDTFYLFAFCGTRLGNSCALLPPDCRVFKERAREPLLCPVEQNLPIERAVFHLFLFNSSIFFPLFGKAGAAQVYSTKNTAKQATLCKSCASHDQVSGSSDKLQ